MWTAVVVLMQPLIVQVEYTWCAVCRWWRRSTGRAPVRPCRHTHWGDRTW
jgi:hypothetical protein